MASIFSILLYSYNKGERKKKGRDTTFAQLPLPALYKQLYDTRFHV